MTSPGGVEAAQTNPHWVPRAVLDECIGQRDRARDVAVALEQEVADLRAKVDAVRSVALGRFTAEYLASIPDHLISSETQLRRAVLAALGGVAGRDDTEETTT